MGAFHLKCSATPLLQSRRRLGDAEYPGVFPGSRNIQAWPTKSASDIISPKTLRTYTQWVRHFQTFTYSADPKLLNSEHVKDFLTHLAVKKKVSASTQNQAFNTLLFFYRHVLKREFGKMEGVIRAKRKPYVPVVLSRKEIDAILAHLMPPYDLVVKLLYGCGLRLFECLRLRVQCFNFDAEVLTVHDGKGQKDRTVPIPKTIFPELLAHLEFLKDLHRQDLERGYAGVFLVNALEKKYLDMRTGRQQNFIYTAWAKWKRSPSPCMSRPGKSLARILTQKQKRT